VIEADGWIEVGAMVTHAEVASSERIAAHCPLLARAAASIGHHAIRARGTLGGSIVHADPAAQLPLVAAALDARIEIASARGRRSVPAAEFFVAVMTTVLEPDELVVAVRFPVAASGERAGFAAFARRSGDFAIVAAAATVAVSEGRVAAARLALGGVGPVPVVLRELTAAQAGRPADGAWADATAEAACRAADVQDDLRIPAVYRGELVRTMVSRALRAAIGQEEDRS
jgi:carbon-monoxide dehydrogenase medium subunit